MVATSTVIELALKTYAWLQLQWTIGACLNSPSLRGDCFQGLYFCNGVPLPIDRPIFIDTSGTPNTFSYQYTAVKYYGVSRANLTQDSSVLNQLAAGLLAATCQTNSTCFKAWSSNSSSLSAVQTYIANNTKTVISMLPPDASAGVWLPQVEYAASSFTGVYSALPSFNSEIFGIHDILVDGLVSGAVNHTRFSEMQRLQLLQSGGMTMMEAILNKIIFASYDCQGYMVTSYSAQRVKRNIHRRTAIRSNNRGTHNVDISPYILSGMSDVERYKIYQHFTSKSDFVEWASSQQGGIRSLLSRLTPSESMYYLQDHLSMAPMSPAMTPSLVARATCAYTTQNQNTALQLNSAAAVCSATSTLISAGMLFAPVNAVKASTLVSKQLALVANSKPISIANFVSGTLSTACAFTSLGKSTCYPAPDAFSASAAGNYLGLALDVVSLGAVLTTGAGEAAVAMAAFGLGLDLTCSLASQAADAYDHAASCCQKSCASPACTAAGLFCVFSATSAGC